MSRMPTITWLENGQAVKVGRHRPSVTSSFGSARLRKRATDAPPKPPPITTIFAPCLAPTRAAATARRTRAFEKAAPVCACVHHGVLCRIPGGDRPDFVVGETFGEPVHDRCRGAARPETPSSPRRSSPAGWPASGGHRVRRRRLPRDSRCMTRRPAARRRIRRLPRKKQRRSQRRECASRSCLTVPRAGGGSHRAAAGFAQGHAM